MGVDTCVVKDALLNQLDEVLDRLDNRITKADLGRRRLEQEFEEIVSRKSNIPKREWINGNGDRLIANTVSDSVLKLWNAPPGALQQQQQQNANGSVVSSTSSFGTASTSNSMMVAQGNRYLNNTSSSNFSTAGTVGQNVSKQLRELSQELLDLMPMLEEHLAHIAGEK